MKTHSTQNIILWSMGFLTVTFALGWGFLIYASSNHKTDTNRLKEEVWVASEKDSHFDSMEKSLREMAEQIENAQARFIKSEEVPTFIRFLEDTAKDEKVSMTLGAISIDDVAAEARALHVRLSGSGSWVDVIDFVSQLDAAPYALSLDTLSLMRPIEAKGWQFNIDLIEYLAQ